MIVIAKQKEPKENLDKNLDEVFLRIVRVLLFTQIHVALQSDESSKGICVIAIEGTSASKRSAGLNLLHFVHEICNSTISVFTSVA